MQSMQSIIEYNINRIKEPLGELDDMLIGPCYDDNRDQSTEFRGRGGLAAVERADRQMRATHDGDIQKFLEACPHLDPVRALELLSEFPMAEAIKKGMKVIMTPKEHVPAWVKQQLGDPTDLKFTADNAFIDKLEKDRRKLGTAFVEPPILRIKEIVKGEVAAEDPQQMESAHTKVVWSDAMVAARQAAQAARLRDARYNARQNWKGSPDPSECQAKRAKK